MQTSKLDQLIQAAAQNLEQETQWIKTLFQTRMKLITEPNKALNENTQTD